MTSKEIQEMIIDLEDQIERFGVMNTFNFQLSILKSYKQDLERLEMLEKENQELNDVIEKYNHLNIQSFFIRDREREENEKLKKAFKILTQRIIIKAHRNFLFGGRHLDVASTTMKLTDEEYELLKEVLGDE